VQQAEAAIQQGRANENLARLTAGRMANLLGRGVISKQDNDNAQAQYAAQQANVEALIKAAAAMRSSVTAAEANLARLNQIKTYQTVRAPFDGVITLRNVDTGALVNEGSTSLPRRADWLLHLHQLPQADAELSRWQRAVISIAERPAGSSMARLPAPPTLDPPLAPRSPRSRCRMRTAPHARHVRQVDLTVPATPAAARRSGDMLVARQRRTGWGRCA
jgi:multidrug efflux pump subunit AcrA (membrane-fusion protein)